MYKVGYKIFKFIYTREENEMRIVEEGFIGVGNAKVRYAIVEEIPGVLYYVICPSLRFFEYCRDLAQCRKIALSLSTHVRDFLYV